MKCTSCHGSLSLDNFLICPYCGTHQEIDLKSIHFRDLGPAQGMNCPRCVDPSHPLGRVGLDLGGRDAEIERCGECQGLFFNPGELEAFLETQVASTLWTDLPRMDLIKEEIQKMPRPEENEGRFYIPCPQPGCGVSMNRRNFGRGSGLMIDSCMHHGNWLDGGELRALAGWWHAGGKFVHQAGEVKAAQNRMERPKKVPDLDLSEAGSGSWLNPLDTAPDWDSYDAAYILGALASAVVGFFSH